jgi:hypothetical protein
MHKLKKAAALALMVGGIGLVGSGVASAHGGDYDDPFPNIAINNLQAVDCDQAFDGGLAFTNTGPAVGDGDQHIGNFCEVSGGIED